MPIYTQDLRGKSGNRKAAPAKNGKGKVLSGYFVSRMVVLREMIHSAQLELDKVQLACGYELRESVEDKEGKAILIEAYPNCHGEPGEIYSFCEPDYFVLNERTGLYEESGELSALWADNEIAVWDSRNNLLSLKARYRKFLRRKGA